jgi:hypothetical protein
VLVADGKFVSTHSTEEKVKKRIEEIRKKDATKPVLYWKATIDSNIVHIA